MEKKAQITVFLLLGLVVLIAAMFFIYLNSADESGSQIEVLVELPSQIQPFKSFVDDCLRSTLEDAIVYVSLQGGYYIAPELSTQFSLLDIPFYYHYAELNLAPSRETVESQISQYIEDLMPICTDTFKAFETFGYSTDEGRISASIVIARDSVIAKISYPIKITKEDFSFRLDEFTSSTDSILGNMYQNSKDIITAMEAKPGSIPLSFMVGLGIKEGFTVEVLHRENSTIIFSLIDNQERLPSIYAFAVRFDWHLQPDESVRILPIPNQNATAEYLFGYDVDALPENVRFYDYTEMFEINESTGTVEFVPESSQKGLHRIMIKARNEKGKQDHEFMNLNVLADNDAPSLQPISDKFLQVSVPFNYQVVASDPNNDSLFFDLETELADFNIDLLTGEMNFVPRAEQVGQYNATVTVVDTHGAIDKEGFEVTVYE